ncbi:MAG: hypothetical protein KGZ67_04605 [Hydrogenophaga sp.]|jgi:hypothetical protein|nr:hypothetical protein [Hydrogenophaga sp.]
MINSSVSYKHVTRSLKRLQAELPGVAARMLTEFARVGADATQRAMPQAFDRPTPFTVKRVLFSPATKTDLRSVTGIPNSNDAAGKPTSEYMRPGALGAARRNQKKTEFLLSKRGFLPPGWVMVPGSFMKDKKDGFGNVPGSYYKQVIRSLQIRQQGDRYLKGISKASQARAARMGVASEFFAVGQGRNTLAKGGGWLPPGVYRRAGRKGERLEQYFVFMPRAAYKKRLDMPKVVTQAVKDKAPAVWQSVMRDVAARVIEKAGRASA